MNRLCIVLAAVAALATFEANGAEYRTYDGTGNNVANSGWGAAETELLRRLPADYRGDAAFGTTVDDRGRLSGREISNILAVQTGAVNNSRGMTSGAWQWGQFIDHDITLTHVNAAETSMLMSPGDPYGVTMIPFSRSVYDEDTSGDRQQINSLTSYIDASNVYGADQNRAQALRELSGGRLKTSAGGQLLPTNDMTGLEGLENANNGVETKLFVAGDIRSNEQLGLISIHTLFMREHNRLADELAARHAGDASWDDERLYQSVRRIVGAEIQAITYNEFLPAMLGSYAPRSEDYSYDSTINAGIENEFSTAFFRLGHTMLTNEIELCGDGGQSIGAVDLADAFFTPSKVLDRPEMVEEVLMGLAMQKSQEIDTKLVDGVRNFLFAPQGQMGLDLAALNITRGREHGIADYNTLRVAYGLDAVDSFDDITSDPVLQAQLALAFSDVDNIDPWMGALAEDHLPGASLGPLLTAGLVDQYTRLRDGDRFFYMGDDLLNSPELDQMIDFSSLTMMDILDWNLSMSGMPSSFFMAVPEPSSLWLAAIGLVGLRRRRVSLAPRAA